MPYEPRHPVPWGPVGGLLATAFVFVTVASAAGGGHKPEPPPIPNPLETIQNLLTLVFTEVVLTGGMLFAIAVISHANERDLGLPTYADEFARDAGIGMLACLAALVPVFALQYMVMSMLDNPEEVERNPLIEMIFREPRIGVMLLASVAAVIVAPICEEIVFRLLLQGWLEKMEDRIVGWRQPLPVESPELADTSPRGDEPPIPLHLDEPPEFANGRAPGELPAVPPAEPPRRGFLGLPYGWLPIVVSSLLFALAHFGSGPDPVPLFVFALILGFLYQRTHRIIPCIVAHAMFNLITMLTLWRLVSQSIE